MIQGLAATKAHRHKLGQSCPYGDERKRLHQRIVWGTELEGTLPIADPRALYAVDCARPKQKKPTPELLPPAAADRASRRRLTKSKERETIIINRSGRSTYPEEKSVQTNGATPDGTEPGIFGKLTCARCRARRTGRRCFNRYMTESRHCQRLCGRRSGILSQIRCRRASNYRQIHLCDLTDVY